MIKKLFLYKRMCDLCKQTTNHARTASIAKGPRYTDLMECENCGKSFTEDNTPEEHFSGQ